MHWKLRAVHENRFSLGMLMNIKESNNPSWIGALAIFDKFFQSGNLWNQAFI
jgi:hypothetical protein